MIPNFPIIAACALITFITGQIYFHESLFGGSKWHYIAHIPKDKRTDINNLKLLLTFLLNFLIALAF